MLIIFNVLTIVIVHAYYYWNGIHRLLKAVHEQLPHYLSLSIEYLRLGELGLLFSYLSCPLPLLRLFLLGEAFARTCSLWQSCILIYTPEIAVR